MTDFTEAPLTPEEQVFYERYFAAAHAMQSGVAGDIVSADMVRRPGRSDPAGVEPKMLRAGVNTALVEQSAIARLLVRKGLITRLEYFEAIAVAMETEQVRYEKLLSERTGAKVTLG